MLLHRTEQAYATLPAANIEVHKDALSLGETGPSKAFNQIRAHLKVNNRELLT